MFERADTGILKTVFCQRYCVIVFHSFSDVVTSLPFLDIALHHIIGSHTNFFHAIQLLNWALPDLGVI